MKHNCDGLTNVSHSIALDSLRKGDVLNDHVGNQKHVVFFVQWMSMARDTLMVTEARSYGVGDARNVVDMNTYALDDLLDEGEYVPYAYDHVILPPVQPCGDVDNDGVVDFMDILYLIEFVFQSGPPPVCDPIIICANVNGDGLVDFLDVLYLIDYIFKGCPPPVGYPGPCSCP